MIPAVCRLCEVRAGGQADRLSAGRLVSGCGERRPSVSPGETTPLSSPRDLRVTVRSVQRWWKAWAAGGTRALAAKGPASLPLLSGALFGVLERELDKSPLAFGWPDQTWTLSRIKTLFGRRFRKTYTIQGVAAALKRHGWTCRSPRARSSSEMRKPWPAGCRRPGRTWNDRGGARRLARVRGRGRILDDAANHRP
ncbi:winged helix-turn-helix domain-containing protein [Streptomyces sp. NBC_00878]|uniref:winged helix-turn-helix domain-containing protein n=1 Tax=Streptomyces sp. NBC_00878 TaxID=2975854 RepID=UPI002258F8F3|nr:winged helix-turn-helix domain-containing protein [Streptomyces sp. NBC_00878]MCX4904481.1 winged helix-turn-helix domain-containing protein [Streptomyces sp. NBC_00878]